MDCYRIAGDTTFTRYQTHHHYHHTPGFARDGRVLPAPHSLKDAPEGFVVGSPGEGAQSGGTGPFLLKLKSSGGGGGKRSRSASISASTAGVGGGGGVEVRIRFSLAWRRDVRLDYSLEFKVRGPGSWLGRRTGRRGRGSSGRKRW